MIKLPLPYPPSVNHYWHLGRQGRVFIGKKGRGYRATVVALLKLYNVIKLEGRLEINISLYPPDRRKRDLDNVLKALLDALCHAGVYNDDSQIDVLRISRKDPIKGGEIIVELTEIGGTTCISKSKLM
jgi:crossover junction endodeoxyribonuclease RusA